MGRIAVIAAAGVNADNADVIISGTGVHGVHAGSSLMSKVCHEMVPGDCMGTATMGTGGNADDDMKWEAVDEIKVARYVNTANEGFSTYQRNCMLLPPPPISLDDEKNDIAVYPTYF